MQAGLLLLVHGEVTDPSVDFFDREKVSHSFVQPATCTKALVHKHAATCMQPYIPTNLFYPVSCLQASNQAAISSRLATIDSM